jgi:uncharacterized protein YkwD
MRAISTAALSVALVAVIAIVGSAQARPAPTMSDAAAEACPSATELVSRTTAAELRKSIRCLITVERGTRGLAKLIRNKNLEVAAKRHVRTMIETDCLAHRCPGEVDLKQRLRRAGYFDGFTSYSFAESTGCGTTAGSMVSSWLASSFDRSNILDSDLRDLGVAVSAESSDELCGDDYGTFAIVLGSRTAKRG